MDIMAMDEFPFLLFFFSNIPFLLLDKKKMKEKKNLIKIYWHYMHEG